MRSGIALLHVAQGNNKNPALLRTFGRKTSKEGYLQRSASVANYLPQYGILQVLQRSKYSITRQYCALLIPSASVHFSKECQSAENKSHTAVTTLTFVGFHANLRALMYSATESLSSRSINTIFIKGHHCKKLQFCRQSNNY